MDNDSELLRAPTRGLTLWQPWATLMAIRQKMVETRSWPTEYRGVVFIHAAKAIPAEYRESVEAVLDREEFKAALRRVARANPERLVLSDLPSGCIVAVGRLVGCYKASASTRAMVEGAHGPREMEFGDYTDGRFLHEYEDILTLEVPVACRGAQQFWTVPQPAIEEAALQFRGHSHVLHREHRAWIEPILTRKAATL